MSKREKERSDEGVRTISKRMRKEEKYLGKGTDCHKREGSVKEKDLMETETQFKARDSEIMGAREFSCCWLLPRSPRAGDNRIGGAAQKQRTDNSVCLQSSTCALDSPDTRPSIVVCSALWGGYSDTLGVLFIWCCRSLGTSEASQSSCFLSLFSKRWMSLNCTAVPEIL